MVRNLSEILGILVLTGMFPSEMVCAMANEGEESPHSSSLAKNVENETENAGGQIGDGLRKFAGHFRKKK